MFFFFKQKTAYEMRISDWSSDVCSSDLRFQTIFPARMVNSASSFCFPSKRTRRTSRNPKSPSRRLNTVTSATLPTLKWPKSGRSMTRSEEHTSELQSLMRISYAVFCLKHKKQTKIKKKPQNTIKL